PSIRYAPACRPSVRSRSALLRLAPFPAAAHYEIGPTACTPERSGLMVRFSEFSIGPAITRDLHDLS
ncbi:DUF1349 domain-containing protein, partial [Rhizobium leguminosarum]